jgi:hypothetical protein
MLDQLTDRLDVFTVLSACGIDHRGRHRLPCPIHGGDDPNFAIHDDGRSWTCHSHHCGAGHKRDAVNLYCCLAHGAPLPKLDIDRKREALRELCEIAGLDYAPDSGRSSRGPVNRFDAIPLQERQALAAIFADTSRLAPDDLGQSRLYTSKGAQRVILYLAVAASMGKLPPTITRDWEEYPKLEERCNAG